MHFPRPQLARRAGVTVTPAAEAELLIKAIRVNTLSKLTFDDASRFVGLLADVFPVRDAAFSTLHLQTLRTRLAPFCALGGLGRAVTGHYEP